MQDADYPKTTAKRIIIKTATKKAGFYRNSYNVHYLGRHISNKRYDNMVNEFSKILAHNYSRKQKEDRGEMHYWDKIATAVALLLGFISIVMSGYLIDNKNNAVFWLFTFGFMITGTSIIFLQMLHNTFYKDDIPRDVEATTFEELYQLGEKYNDDFLKDRGLEMVVNQHLDWIELHINVEKEPDRVLTTILQTEEAYATDRYAINTNSIFMENKDYEDEISVMFNEDEKALKKATKHMDDPLAAAEDSKDQNHQSASEDLETVFAPIQVVTRQLVTSANLKKVDEENKEQPEVNSKGEVIFSPSKEYDLPHELREDTPSKRLSSMTESKNLDENKARKSSGDEPSFMKRLDD